MPSPSVLFIDDEPSLCLAMKQLLERHGFAARTASSMDAAVAEVRAASYDAVVMDFWFGRTGVARGGAGDDLFHELVAIDPSLRKRTVFVTGDFSPTTEERIFRTGAPHLMKPFEIGLLVSSLQTILQAEGARAEQQTPGQSNVRLA